VRNGGTTKQRIWLGADRYSCGCERWIAHADTNGNRYRNGEHDCDANCDSHPNGYCYCDADSYSYVQPNAHA
jgi:hypothetical protein